MKLNVKETMKTVRDNTNFQSYLSNIKVEIINRDFVEHMPEVLMSTWAQHPGDMTGELRKEVLDHMWDQKFLPAAMEFINITVAISGINSHDVTHLLRYRDFTFLGDCTGDKVLSDRPITVPESIQESPYYTEYIDLMHRSMRLYNKMMNDQKMPIQEARLVLPRTIETFYYVQMNLRDAIKFIMHRVDEQVQPMGDNILALRLYEAIQREYPQFKLDLTAPNMHYINEYSHKYRSSFFMPNKSNKKAFEDRYGSDYMFKFNYGLRSSMYGSDSFEAIKKEILDKCELL